MNETTTQLDKSLSMLIEGATEKGTKLIDFLYQQAPEVIEQLLMWKAAESAIQFVFGVFLAFVCPFLIYKAARKYYKWCEAQDYEFSDAQCCFPIIYGSIISFMITQISTWANGLISLDWLKIWVAPKVWLLEYLAEFVK